MRLPIIPNPPSLPEKETPSPSPLTQDARCPSSYLSSYGARNGRPAATVPLSPNRILISSTETGNHAAPGQASITPGQAGSEKTRAPGQGECAGAPFPGTFTSRCRPRPGARGAARGGLANRASMLAATPLASPSPTRRRAVARPFQGRVSRQRLKAPGLNADHRRRVRTDSSNCSVRKSKPCIQARSGTTLASLAFAIG